MFAWTPLFITLNVHCLPCYAAVWALSTFLPFLQWKSWRSSQPTLPLSCTPPPRFLWGTVLHDFYMIDIVVLRPTNICCAGRLTSLGSHKTWIINSTPARASDCATRRVICFRLCSEMNHSYRKNGIINLECTYMLCSVLHQQSSISLGVGGCKVP